jgi:N-acetylglucosamine kinase-like BadF-type ATPase
VLHAGTGSFVAARTAEGNPADLPAGTFYAGGLGWKLGDPGSGYDIGRRGIARGLLELQGWADASALGAALRLHVRLADADAITRHLYRQEAAAADVTQFAPAVLQAAEGGDRAARQVVLESAGELLDTAIAVAAKLFPRPGAARAGLSGHILTYPFVVEALAKCAPFPVFPVADSPEEGLRRLVARWRP